VGENICHLYIRQGADNRIYRELKKLNFPKINEPIKKWATELKKLSQKKKFKWPKKHEKMLTSLAIKEMQIKTTLRFHLTPVRIAIISNTTNNRFWSGCGEKGTLVHCWWECKLVQPLWKTIWKLFKKTKHISTI
jgi:hypothetical protein